MLYHDSYSVHQKAIEEREERLRRAGRTVPAYMQFMQNIKSIERSTGFTRMQRCRDALSSLDTTKWRRSYHQSLFHEDFLRACTRIFWKTEPDGQFARDHRYILEYNGWDHLDQEMLVSTPRRFGKTISISMFAAALMFSCPAVEISIYSTCEIFLLLSLQIESSLFLSVY